MQRDAERAGSRSRGRPAASDMRRRGRRAALAARAGSSPGGCGTRRRRCANCEQHRAERAAARCRAGAGAERDEPARHEAFAQRIDALGGAVRALIPHVAALASEQQGGAGARGGRARAPEGTLAAYTTQARFAVAQTLRPRRVLARKDGRCGHAVASSLVSVARRAARGVRQARSGSADERADAEDPRVAPGDGQPEAGIQADEGDAIARLPQVPRRSPPKAQQRPEAMRRLGDLEMDAADTGSRQRRTAPPTTRPRSRATRSS